MAYLTRLTKQEQDDLKRGQNILTDIFREFDRICRENDLKYWCVGGTLIGAIRHKGWVPWDGDIDVSMIDTDYIKLRKIIQEELPKGMWFQDRTTDKYYKSNIGKIRYLYAQYDDYKAQHWHNGLQLDIFINNLKNNILTPSLCNNDSQPTEYDIIFPLKELSFENITVYVPNQYKRYSINAWGDCPPPMIPLRQQYPHEGRMSFNIPKWMEDKYPLLYSKKNVITFGTYDILHIGHVKLIERAAAMKGVTGKLIVGVSSDSLNFSKKNRHALFSEDDRMEIISNIKGVDEVFLEESLALKRKYIIEKEADILVMGDDWINRFDEFRDICEVIYIPRTPGISTTSTINEIISRVVIN